MPDRTTPTLRAVFLGAGALLLAACWDAPVRETVEVELLADGSARAELRVELDRPGEYEKEGQEPMRRRLERKARDLDSGADPWLAHFDVEGCPRQGGGWQRDEGDLVEFRRFMQCETPEQAFRVLDPAPVAIDVTTDDEVAELVLLPLGGGAAGRRDRERAEAEIDRWAGEVETYLAAAYAVAARAAARPDLAIDLWAESLDLTEKRSRELADGDRRLARELRDAVDRVLGVLRPRPGAAETADELVRSVFDPLPARLVVRLPSAALAVEGFEERSGARYAVPERSLYATYRELAGLWLAPDLIVEHVELGRAGRHDQLSAAPFAAGDPRRAEAPPAATEIAAALRAELERREPLRLTWRAPEREEGEGDAGLD